MMTKEEVAQVMAYCDENKISYKQRLSELGISPWNFYDAKRKYAPKEEGENAGEFLQLIPGGTFLPNPIKPSRSRSNKQKESAQETVAVNIDLRTPTGTMLQCVLPPSTPWWTVAGPWTLNPREWMEDVLLRLPGNENNREALRELLPDKWAKQTN